MPADNVEDEQKRLHLGVLIGWGCLIYNHRKQNPSLDISEPAQDYKMLLGCIGELFFATGFFAEFRYLEELFLNYDCQPRLRIQVEQLLTEIKIIYKRSYLPKWYEHFSITGFDLGVFKTIKITNLMAELKRVYLCLSHFEALLGIPPDLSKTFLRCALNDYNNTLNNYEKFWRPAFVFLMNGYRSSPQELSFELNNRELTIHLDRLSDIDPASLSEARRVTCKELQEELTAIKNIDTLKINNFDFTPLHDEVAIELKILLQHCTIGAVKIGLAGTSQYIFDEIKQEFAAYEKSHMMDYQFANFMQKNLEQAHFLVGMCMLQAHIQSMTNVQNNNISRDYWQQILAPYDEASKRNWLEFLNRKLQEYSGVLKIEDGIWKVIRDQIIHGDSRALTHAEKSSYEAVKRDALLLTDTYIPSRNAAQTNDRQFKRGSALRLL